MDLPELVAWLQETDADRLAELWHRADTVRQENVGGEVHLRGLVEVSSHCVRLCAYCGLRAPNRGLGRYRMTADEVLDCAQKAVEFGYGTLVMQAGEDPGLAADWVADLVGRIKSQTPLAVTLSLGEREPEELALWREAGADRYLLRFETSNPRLYQSIHPPRPAKSREKGSGPCFRPTFQSEDSVGWPKNGPDPDRLDLLRLLRGLGYEVGSGVMIGIPGQTYNDLAADIALFASLDLDMIGVGPYLVHPDTPLAKRAAEVEVDEQVPADELTTYKVIALARLVCPKANIPATTALATLNKHSGRELGLTRGANVVMPNLTPVKYRSLYEIYPDKACIAETAEACNGCLAARLEALGRSPGIGRGDSPNYGALAARSKSP